jgi:hypothetical protein
MSETRSVIFDPESFAQMWTALDEAWKTLPASDQSPDMKSALAKTILALAAEGERDRVELSQRALNVMARRPRHDFEVLNGDERIALVQSFDEGPGDFWPRIVELAKTHAAPGRRIRVMDQSGAVVMLVGVATALRVERVIWNKAN